MKQVELLCEREKERIRKRRKGGEDVKGNRDQEGNEDRLKEQERHRLAVERIWA